MTTKEPGEPFFERWSRMKREANERSPEEAAEKAPAKAADPKAPPPELPPVEKLTIESDYRGFFHPKVDEKMRRVALRKLFSDPRFNVMDGLDVYIDDYSKTEPIPAAMLAQLRQAQEIFKWAKGEDETKPAAAEKQQDAPQARAALEQQPPSAAPAERVADAGVPVADEPRERGSTG